MAAAVTIADVVLAFPFAYYMVRVAGPRERAALFVLVLVPLWSSYLARVYAWRLIFAHDGMLELDAARRSGFEGVEIGYTNWAMWIVFAYLWLPFMILPIFAAIERIPAVAARGLAGSRRQGPAHLLARRPAARPARRRGRLDLHLLPDARRLHHARARGRARVGLHRQRRLCQRRHRQQRALRGRLRRHPARRDGALSRDRPATRRVRRHVSGAAMESRAARIALRAWVGLVVLFLFTPIVLILVYAFNASNIQTWPIAGLSLRWFGSAFANEEIRTAMVLSLKASVVATSIALLLGSAAALAVHRYAFFGRETVSFIVVLPIALPGIITGMALNSFFVFWGIGLSFWTIVIGHATFCIVIVYNNVIARLRRVPLSLEEASMDLGADPWRTFRRVTLADDLDLARRRRPARLRAVLRRGDRHHLHRRCPEHAARCGSSAPFASARGCRR